MGVYFLTCVCVCVQGKIKVAKEAYEKFLVRDNLPPALKAVALRQLGEYGDCVRSTSVHMAVNFPVTSARAVQLCA